MLTQVDYNELEYQQQFFQTGKTKNLDFRIQQLKILQQAIENNKDNIVQALKADLHKSGFEAYFEIIGVLEEIKYALKNIRAWTKPQKAATPFYQFLSSAQVRSEPLGVILIIGPWNYPFNLIFAPLVGAIAAGNCAILKPSEIAPYTSEVIEKIVH